ncbi:MAG: ATP-binding cassette domain-containing protein [Candidatus Hodarchaeota archaeon]
MQLKVTGAQENNLANIDVEFKDGLTVVTGISGSGKSSLVFSTLYYESRRRFLNIFARSTASARLAPAKVKEITGLGPTIAIEQNILNRNPKSTLATASGLHPFFRLLYTNFGERTCPSCGKRIQVYSEDEIINKLSRLSREEPIEILAPIVINVKGSHRTLIELLVDEFGLESLAIDSHPYKTHILDPQEEHTIEIRLTEINQSTSVKEIRDIYELVSALGANNLRVITQEGTQLNYSLSNVCNFCGIWLRELRPLYFHTPCKFCKGGGCRQCKNTGLLPETAGVFWKGYNLHKLLKLSVDNVYDLFKDHNLPETASRLVLEITNRLKALITVGLGYISLNRPSPTLSRGESQRVRLAMTLTSRLEDMLVVLDEPTIGLSIDDVNNLLPTFRQLPGSVIFVEHDRVAAAAADHSIDLGPGAGKKGGKIVFKGNPASLWKADTITSHYFSMRERVSIPTLRSKPTKFIKVKGANLRNLKNIDIQIPLNRLSVVTGPSGSGKSTLVEDVLYSSLSGKEVVGCKTIEGSLKSLKTIIVDQKPIGKNPRSNPATYTNLAAVIREIFCDLSKSSLTSSHFSFNRPEGACPECNGMGAIEVKMRYLPSTWITCSACEGKRFSDQVLEVKINFGDNSYSIADFYELSVDEVNKFLIENDTIVISAKNRNKAKPILHAMREIGLGYLTLGQPSPSLSGGEAQRVKLAKYLGKKSLANHILILDEPSTGLHAHDISGLLKVLDRLVRAGATIIVVEHNPDFIRAADWVIDLGPGAGPVGGHLIFAGSPNDLLNVKNSVTTQGLLSEASIQPNLKKSEIMTSKSSSKITINHASAHNLKDISVKLPKGKITVVTGVSGSGKSSLVNYVLKSEAERRFLETLSLYERQGISEGPEAPVESITGLGVAVSVDPARIGRGWYNYRSTVGLITELSHHITILMSSFGEYKCPKCNKLCDRDQYQWICNTCNVKTSIPSPRYFSTSNYSSACTNCHGVGTLRKPQPEKLIVSPEKPLCKGAMYSPGFFPQGYICKRYNGGYYIVQAIAKKYGFDPNSTPWNEINPEAQRIFLFGDPEPLDVTFESRKRGPYTRKNVKYPGFYGWIRDWDVGGTYTTTEVCPDCHGAGFRKKYLTIKLAGFNIHELRYMTFKRLTEVLETYEFQNIETNVASYSLNLALQKLQFLNHVGLGYLHLGRLVLTLSAGEAQRIRLAGLLGSGLTDLTVLMDEPSRGMHPSEINALLKAITSLRDEGNTVVIVEHDLQIIQAADKILDLGPGPGVNGGTIIAEGTPEEVSKTNSVTGLWLSGSKKIELEKGKQNGLMSWLSNKKTRKPQDWMKIIGASENNLKGNTVEIPLGVLVGISGVSGSGKSTLIIDTLGRVLAPKKQTTSVAYEPIEPGKYDSIQGAPKTVKVIDQSRKQVYSPLTFFNLRKPLISLYATSDDAKAIGLDEKQLSQRCSNCKGTGQNVLDMGFLPNVFTVCESCEGTGLISETKQVRLHGYTLPELFKLTIDEVYQLFTSEEKIFRPLKAAKDVGLGYLVLKQPGFALSGGECQRMKIAKELSKKTKSGPSLYILDEPTVGQHMEDVNRLIGVLNRLVDDNHSVIVIEHHPHLLAACDYILELGPTGGPDGGYVIAKGTPEEVSKADTPTAPFLRKIMVNES